MTWAPSLKGKSVHFHCDNLPVVQFVVKRSTPPQRPDLSHLTRWLTQIALKNQFYFWISHIPGKLNIEADNLSRFKLFPLKRLYLPQSRLIPSLKPFFDRASDIIESQRQWNRSECSSIISTILHQQPWSYL